MWEKRYGIINPERSQTNIRCYSEHDLRTLLHLSLLNRQGLKISHLARMSAEEMHQLLSAQSLKTMGFETEIHQWIASVLLWDEEKINQSFQRCERQFGFESCMENVVFPALNLIGFKWIGGQIEVAQEHFVSHRIKQKIMVHIAGIKSKIHVNPRRFLLFLPEGEWHEMGLLYASYLIQNAGHQVLFLGQSTPLLSAQKADIHWKSDSILISFTPTFSEKRFLQTLDELKTLFDTKNIYIHTPFAFENQTKTATNRIIKIQNHHQLKKLL
jgi:DNA-binding transcriptional MerR regulator